MQARYSRGKWLCVGLKLGLVLLFAAADNTFAQPNRGGGGGGGGGGRLSPASLDLDTCGCPTEFFDPTCAKETSWTLEKFTESGPFTNPQDEPFSFTVRVIEGPTGETLTAIGHVKISNSGSQTPTLANVAVLLEDLTEGAGNAPGPSGNNWTILRVVAENEHPVCGNQAVTCDGVFQQSDGSNLILYVVGGDINNSNDLIALSDGVLIPPATDEDGDGRSGEDPALDAISAFDQNCYGVFDQDGDGLLDEDPGFGIEVGIDNDGDGLIDEDPIAGIDNDGDGAVDEDELDGIDNDGDGLVDEDSADDDGDGLINEDDPDDDGDGLVDEDGPDDDRDGLIDEDDNCDDIVEFMFQATFDVSGLDVGFGMGDGVVPSEDDLRIDLLVTFKGGGRRGGTCALDVDCDGILEDGKQGRADEGEGYVRTVQQRLQFDPPVCPWNCMCVTLDDVGAYSLDPDCAHVSSNSINAEICATEVEGTVTEFEIFGTVNCQSCVEGTDLAAFEQDIADLAGADGVVGVSVSHNGGNGSLPYFTGQLDYNGDNVGDDTGLPVYCVDLANVIYSNTWYCALLLSSYSDTLPAEVINPQNLDNANYVLNNFAIGDDLGNGATVTGGDIQRALWALVFGSLPGAGAYASGPSNDANVAAILAAAYASGDDYVPPCDGSIAVIIYPVNCAPAGLVAQALIAQMLVTEFQSTCGTLCEDCVTTVTNVATLNCDEDQSLIDGSPASASFDVACEGGGQPPVEPPGVGDLCSQTQGGWGQTCEQKPNGENKDNPGCLREELWDTVVGGSLVVGDPDGEDGDGLYAIELTSSDAVAELLPTGGTPAALTADQTDPEVTSSGVFGGQLVAATLNRDFDAAGYGLCSIKGDGDGSECTFAYPPGTLGTLVYACDVADGLLGLSVNEVIALSNTAISGGGTPMGVTISDLSDALALLNEEYVDCATVATGCLVLPLGQTPIGR